MLLLHGSFIPIIILPDHLLLLQELLHDHAQRECIRLESISNSPIVSGFNETMNGLCRLYELIISNNSFYKGRATFVTVNKRNRMAREAMENWFEQRLAWMSFLINITAIGYCILAGGSSGAMAGLLLAYSFTLDEYVIKVTYVLSIFRNKMISVERISNFMRIEPESGYTEYVKNWSPSD
jgi:ABC-type multidrug transport system fused ATPase/permease subunit